jgi:DNA-binding NarL/FixJ family response regulator
MEHERQSAAGAAGKHFGLTAREKQVVVFVVAGYTNKDIAQKLGISPQTIKHDVTNIFEKLVVPDRLQLMLFALHHRVIDYAETMP